MESEDPTAQLEFYDEEMEQCANDYTEAGSDYEKPVHRH